ANTTATAAVATDDNNTATATTTKTKTRKSTSAAKTKAPPAAAKTKAADVTVVSLKEQLPPDWQEALKEQVGKSYFKQLEKFVAKERANGPVFPPEDQMFAAFKATPFDKVKVVLLGQDPYHGEGEAHGMCFSVKPGVKIPPSLKTIYKEMEEDVGAKPP